MMNIFLKNAYVRSSSDPLPRVRNAYASAKIPSSPSTRTYFMDDP